MLQAGTSTTTPHAPLSAATLAFRLGARVAVLCVLLGSVSGCFEPAKEELFQKGVKAAAQGNAAGAVVYYKSALERDPGYVAARRELAQVYKRMGKFDKAASEYGLLAKAQGADLETRQEYARLLLAASRIPEAEAEADELLAGQPDGEVAAEMLVLKGNAKLVRGEASRAEGDFLAALAKVPNKASAMLGQARVALADEKYAEAWARLDDSLRADPWDEQAHLLQANMAMREGKVDMALAALDKALAIEPADRAALYRKGLILIDHQDKGGLAQVVESLRALAPNAPDTLCLDGILAYFEGRDEDAARQLNRAQAAVPTPEGFYFLALTHHRRGELELSLTMLRKVLDLKPGYAPARSLIIETLLRQQRYPEATGEAFEAVRLQPDSAAAHAEFGTALVAAGKATEGLREFNRALELDPDMAEVRVRKGLVEAGTGKTAQGEASLLQVLRDDPRNLRGRLLLFALYLQQAQWDKGQALLREALNGLPQDAPLYVFMAEGAMRAGKVAGAHDLLDKAKAADPQLADAYLATSRLYQAQQNMAGAEAELQALLARQPEDADVLFRLAGVQRLAGHPDQAWATLEQARRQATPGLLLAIANACFEAGKADKAVEVVDQYAAAVDHKQGVLAKVRLLRELRRYDQALALLEEFRVSDPGLAAAQRAEVALRRHDLPTAQAEAEQLVMAQPREVQGYLLLAEVQEAGGQRAKAVDTLQLALVKKPEDSTVMLRLGEVLLRSGQQARATDMFGQYLKARPESALGYFYLGVLREGQGKAQEARGLYAQALRRDNLYVPALNNLAYLLLQEQGQESAALTLAIQAYGRQPGDPAVMDSLGYALLRNNQPERALPLLRAAADKLTHPTILYHLALACKQDGDIPAAKAALQKALGQGDFKESAQAKTLFAQLDATH